MAVGFFLASLVRSWCRKDFFVFVLFLFPLCDYILLKTRQYQRLYIHGVLGEPQGEPCRSEYMIAPSRRGSSSSGADDLLGEDEVVFYCVDETAAV